MKVLVTGAAGGVGRVVIQELERAGHELCLLDCAEPMTTRWPYHHADITNADAVRQAAGGMDAIIHLAAIPHYREGFGRRIMEVNVVGAYNLLEAARLAGIKRVLAASSACAFGTFGFRLSGRPPVYEKMPLNEDYPPAPEDAYSLSKLCLEETCAAFHRAYGLTTAAFRLAGVWTQEKYEKRRVNMGPTQHWDDHLYNWVHVADIAAGIRLALEAPQLPGCGVYTLSAADTTCPEPTMDILRRFRPDLLKTLQQPLLGRAPLLSIDRARQAFGYLPRYRLGP